MKYLMTEITSSDEMYDADTFYYVLPLDEGNLTAIKLGQESIISLKNKGARSVTFEGIGYFLKEEILGPQFDKEKFKQFRGTKIKYGVWISDSEEIQRYIDDFGVDADDVVFYEDEFIAKFQPKHFHGEIEGVLTSYDLLSQHTK